jgi:uncharacterized protein YndB with AHSA1/START domain
VARYHFVTEIVVGAPLEHVWDHIADPTRLPATWRWLESTEMLDGATPPVSLGDRCRYAFRTALPYTLSFVTEVTEVSPPTRLVVDASGELAGTGCWELTDVEVGTALRYTWLVETTKRWMNLLAPIGRPAFSWNHDVLMKDFARGLASALDAPLVSVANHTVAPGSPGFGRTDAAA